jgi:DNA primase
MANHIPREFIQLLLSRTELVDLIDGRVPLRKKSSNNYFACCPFHTEKSASFSVSQNKQFYYCFGCGAHGNAIDFLMQYDRMEFPEAVETLARQAGMEIPRESRTYEKPAISNDLYALLENVSTLYQQQLKQSPRAIDYLKQRGLSGEIAKEFGIGFAPPGWDHVLQTLGKTPSLKQQLFDTGMLIKKEEGGYYDRFRERIMFPIQDRRGRVIGFGGRVLDKGEPKYLNSPETLVFQKGHELYGLHQAQQANRQLTRVVIVEGYMDVIGLFQHGVNYAVATLGTATTATHLQRLFRQAPEIIFCFDGDQAGRTAAWRALLVTLPLISDEIQVRFMFLPDGEDPDTLIRKEGKEGFENRIQNAAALSQFFFQSLAAQADLSNMDGRARFAKMATEHLHQVPDGIFRQMMLDELAKRARVDIEHIKPTTKFSAAKLLTTKARPPSTLRLAILLLIQQPSLAQHIDQPLPELTMRGMDLLREIISLAKQHPDLTTGGLLEFWRERDEGKSLAKLAQTEHMVPENGMVNEFLGIIQRLRQFGQKQIIEGLLAKANQTKLSQEEKQQLEELIRSK